MSAAEDRKRPPPPDYEDDGGGKRPAVAQSDDEDTCWLCLEANHESGAPLRRDCSCRGGSGFAHVPCIVEYAKDWSRRHERNLEKFSSMWSTCANCKQPYTLPLSLQLADELLGFVGDNIKGSGHLNKAHLLESLRVSLKTLMPARRDPDMRSAASTFAGHIIRVVAGMEAEESPLSIDVREIEAQAWFARGFIALEEGEEQSPQIAVGHFEKTLEMAREMNNDAFVIAVEAALGRARSRCAGGSAADNSEELEGNRKLYKACEALDEEGGGTILSGGIFAESLKRAHRGIEAERLLTKLAPLSKRVLGPEDDTTKQISAQLEHCTTRMVKIKSKQGDEFQAMKYEEDSGDCVVRNKTGETFSVAADDIILTLGTPVSCDGLEESAHLNGKIGDVRSFDEQSQSYKVHFEDGELEPRLIRGHFLRILFDLPQQPQQAKSG